MTIATINPATGETIKVFEALSDPELENRIRTADQTFLAHRADSLAQRSTWMMRAAEILVEEKETCGRLITLEMGKPLAAAIAEVEKSAWVCRYYAEQAADLLADVSIATDASHSFVTYQPLGVILAVMPWNFPFWQVFRCAAPALMAGNSLVLKHASNVPQSALMIEQIFQRAGFPVGLFQTLLIGSERIASLIADDRIRGAALTGSEPAGISLATAAGKALKKVVLELGGSDPFIVLESADLDLAVQTAVTARMISNGQSCIAAKRFIIQESIADRFEQRLVELYQALKLGDPLDPATQIGPLATPRIRQELHQQVESSVAAGAQLLTGGKLPNEPGNFYPPTILTRIPPGCPAEKEEFFGPVALLFRVPDCQSAIQLANDSPFGLGASAWTQIPAEQQQLIDQLEAGSVFINGMVKSDPRLPFGGIKRSGYGRELGREGILEFVNVKTVWMK